MNEESAMNEEGAASDTPTVRTSSIFSSTAQRFPHRLGRLFRAGLISA